MSVLGTKLPIQDVRYSVAIEGKADIVAQGRNDANDPERTKIVFKTASTQCGRSLRPAMR
jgi:hypothetical protein